MESSKTRKGKYFSKYKESYHAEWDCVTRSKKGEYHAFCSVCSVDVCIKFGGRNDMFRHISSDKHKEMVKVRSSSRGIQSFFRSSHNDGGVTNAEALFAAFLVEHNLPIASADHAGPLFRQMFPDSQIATKYACARTKTTEIIHTMSKKTASDIAEQARNSPFSLATDGSNDGGSEQLYPVLLTYFDNSTGQVKQALLSLPALTEVASTGENIFKLLDRELTKERIPWTNCLSFAADNASVMLGKYKGVATFIQQEHSECYIVGCPCHMAHNTAEKASKALPIAIDELLVDIYFYLDKSSKRQKTLRALQTLCDTGTRKILKHGATRWLSLGICIERLLSQWEPLQLFFKEEVKPNTAKTTSKVLKKLTSTEKNAKESSTTSASTLKQGSSTSAGKQTTSSAGKQTTSSAGKQTSASTLNKQGSSTSAGKQTTSSAGKQTSASTLKQGSSTSAGKQTPSSAGKQISASTLKQGSSTSAGKQISASTLKQGSSKSAGKQNSTVTMVTIKQGSSSSATPQGKSGLNKLKRKASGPQSADLLPSKRPLLKPKAGTKESPCVQESRLARIHRLMISPQTKLYCYFLQYSNKIFDSINLLLQREEPCLHILHRKLSDTYRDLLLRFVKPECIAACSHVKDVSYGKENQRSDKDLMIGTEAKEYIKTMTSEENDVSLQLTKSDLDYFYLSVRKYYESACGYALKTWPFDVKFLQEAEVLDINLRRKASFSSLHYFVSMFPCILNNSNTSAIDDLEVEFAEYQVENFEDHPEILDSKLRIDKKWNMISDMKDGNGCTRFPLLCRVMKALLVVPHSNAACERAFSIVRKNKTDFRSSMTLDTLQSLLTEKIGNAVPCYKRKFSQELLRDFKQATYKSLQGQASSSTTPASPLPPGQ